MNFAGVMKAPVVFFCRNNGWALSFPASRQTGSSTFWGKGVAYGIPGCGRDRSTHLAQRGGLGRRPVPHRDVVSRRQQAACHRGAHVTGAEKRNVRHAPTLSPRGLTRSSVSRSLR